LLPIGLLPLEVAGWVWMVLSMTLAALALRALLRTFLPGRALVHGLLGLALFVGQPGVLAIVLGQWALLLMAGLAAIVLWVRAGHARRAGAAALMLLAKPQIFVWTAIGLGISAFVDERYRRFVRYAIVLAGAVVVCAWLAYPDWFPAWLADIPPRRTGRSAVLFSAFGQLLGTPGRILAIAVIGAGVLLASRFVPASDAWLAMWLSLSSAGAIYSWSYDQVLLVVPLTIASGVLVASGRERAGIWLAVGGALTLLLVSTLFYAIGVIRHDETFSVAIPVAFFIAIAWSLWPYRRGSLVRERPAQQVQAA
jgi:glycosyl transferase family 87